MQVSPSSRVIQSPPENSAARPYFRLTFTLPLPGRIKSKIYKKSITKYPCKNSSTVLQFTRVYYSLLQFTILFAFDLARTGSLNHVVAAGHKGILVLACYCIHLEQFYIPCSIQQLRQVYRVFFRNHMGAAILGAY